MESRKLKEIEIGNKNQRLKSRNLFIYINVFCSLNFIRADQVSYLVGAYWFRENPKKEIIHLSKKTTEEI